MFIKPPSADFDTRAQIFLWNFGTLILFFLPVPAVQALKFMLSHP